jgi:hypothetical protein
MIPFADNFLAGSIISLLMPVGLLIALTIWYWIVAKRVPDNPDMGDRRHDPGVEPPGPRAPDAAPPAGNP